MQIFCLKSAISRGIFRLIFTKNSKASYHPLFTIRSSLFTSLRLSLLRGFCYWKIQSELTPRANVSLTPENFLILTP